MKAIVLTYDKYHPIAEHMIECYNKLWPDNPFIFRIPYQKYPYLLKEKYGEKIELIKTSSNIVLTMKKLLEDIEDDEWVYWCMDDRYPIGINKPHLVNIYDWIKTITDNSIVSVNFTYKLNDWNVNINSDRKFRIRDSNGHKYYKIDNYKIIWFHQFMRAKALKYLFDNIPDTIKNAKEMDYHKDELKLPTNFKRFVCTKRFAYFGESSNRGQTTLNCVNSMRNYGMEIPSNFKILNKEIFKGTEKFDIRNISSMFYGYYIKLKVLFK